MDIWGDTFGGGSRFQRVFWIAPILSVVAITLMLGGPALLLLGIIFGAVFMTLNYVLSTVPAVVTWFVVFRLGRLLGFPRRAAGILAAPVMALAASPIASLIIGMKFSRSAGPDLELAYQYFWIIAPVSMVVSFLVAAVGSNGDMVGSPRSYAWRHDARRGSNANDERLR